MKQQFLHSHRHFWLWIWILPLALSACLDENVSCVTDAYDTVRVNFLKLDRSDVRNDTIYVESILASNGDLVDVQDSLLSRISLPLNPSGDQVTFYVNWREDSAAELQTDTLIFDYTREQQLVSPECGVNQRYVALRSAYDAFDSVRVAEPDVTLFTNPNVSIYTCQYEYTNIVRARFYKFDTTVTIQNVTEANRDTLTFSRITDDLGNVILDERTALDRVRLPVDTSRNNTTFLFEIENNAGEIVNRSLNVSYIVGNVQFFDCQPQVRARNLDVNSNDYDFTSVVVDQTELTINNNRNLEIFF